MSIFDDEPRWPGHLYDCQLHAPEVLHENRHCAVVLSRAGDKPRLTLLYREGGVGTYDSSLTFPSAQITCGKEETVRALVPAYVRVAEAVEAVVGAGAILDRQVSRVKLEVQLAGRARARLVKRCLTSAGALRATERFAATVESLAAQNTSEVGTAARYAALAAEARATAVDAARKNRLSRLISERPELSVDEIIEEIDRQLPETTSA